MENFRVVKEKYLIYTPAKELLLLESHYGKKPEVFVPYLMQEGMDMNDFTYLESALQELLVDSKKVPLMTKESHHPRLDGSSGKLKKTEWIQIRSYFSYLKDFTEKEEEKLNQAVRKENIRMYYRSFEDLRNMIHGRQFQTDYSLLSAVDMLDEKILVYEKERENVRDKI